MACRDRTAMQWGLPMHGTLGCNEGCPGKQDNVGAGTTAPDQLGSCSSAAGCSRPLLVLGAIAAVGYVLHVAGTAPALDTLHPLISDGSSQVFAADGERLGFIQSDNLRSPVGWNEIPTDLKNATVAIEDQRFYKNDGVDLTGIFRSAVKDITHGAPLQGGSTITMQLVRNLYLGGDQHTLKQKIIEAKLAIDYNEHHSKRSILTSYLNSVPYGTVGGQTALGVQAAARIFFDKPASQLNLEQSALLAGLPQAPSQYNPFRDAGVARQRRNEVLAKMAELHYITAAQASAAEHAPLEVHLGTFYSQRREDFFFEYVREQLEHRYGRKTVEQGGLKVYTTIDLNMQRLARKAIAEVLNEPEDPASAIVTIDPHNGYIEAMAESESYEKSQYNLAADGHRQPGSTFKAIDLADALSRGIDPNSTYYLSHTLAPGWLAGYPTYEVKTFEGTSLNKSLNLVNATLASDNTVYAQLAADLGEETITQMAYKMGVKTHLSSYPAEALGGLTLGRDAAGNVGRLRHPRRRRLAQQADRDHQGRVPRRPCRPQLGHAAPHEGAERRGDVRGDEHPAPERAQRHRHALGDQLPDGRQDGHDQRTRGRLARRVHAELLDGRVDGLSEQARVDDRRPRRAPAGRVSAGGNLARLHGRRHRRQALRRISATQRIDLLPAVLRTLRKHRPLRSKRTVERRTVRKRPDEEAGRTSPHPCGGQRKSRSRHPARSRTANRMNRRTARTRTNPRPPAARKHAPEPAPTGGARTASVTRPNAA